MRFSSWQVVALGVGSALLGGLATWVGASSRIERVADYRTPPSVLIIWVPTLPMFELDGDDDATVQQAVHAPRRIETVTP